MHKIALTNVKNGEIFDYSVVTITGHITTNEKCPQQNHIHIKTQTRTQQTELKSSANWKFVHELQPGPNDLTLTYCCTSTNLLLTYRPKQTTFSVLPVYIVCSDHDGRFQAPSTEDNSPESACARIDVGAKLLQCIFAEKLHERTSVRRTFRLEACVVFKSRLTWDTARKMREEELWGYFGQELMSSELASDGRKYLGFVSFTRYVGEKYNGGLKLYDDLLGITEGHVALGGGGLALFGTACLYTWPERVQEVVSSFEDVTPIDRRKFLDDSCYRGSVGGCFSTTLGSVLHELCHTFGLGHTETGVMGRGFDDVQEVFLGVGDVCNKNSYWTESGLTILLYHRWFNENVTNRPYVLKYDTTNDVLKSTIGVRAVELRHERTEFLVESWTFTKKVLKFQFQIPKRSLRNLHGQNGILVAIDNHGNMLKEVINKLQTA